jgi:RES domain-containing protein
MRLWRLSSQRRARDFDGGYGLANSGRWNTVGRPVTYCSTVPSLTALEKRVHVTDSSLLPPQSMVEYDVPDDIPIQTILFENLPTDWALREAYTQTLGDAWLDKGDSLILMVPSVIIPITSAPDRNVLINHRHSDSNRITIIAVSAFEFDPRLFQP